MDEGLRRVIAQVESENDIDLWRFEPATFARLSSPSPAALVTISAIVRAHRSAISRDTAKVTYASSYGLYQLMGFNIYPRVTTPLRVWWSDAAAQLASLEHFLSGIGEASTSLTDLLASADAGLEFARKYNGSGDPAGYWARMVKAAGVLGLIPKNGNGKNVPPTPPTAA